MESLGATISPKSEASEDAPKFESKTEPPKAEPKEDPEPEVDSDPESELELDMTDVVEPDNEDPKPMGDPSKELSEDDQDKFDAKRSEAMGVFSEGEWEKAIGVFTEAIEIKATSAMPFVKRGQCFLKLSKPNACIRDCDRAIEINPDNAAAHKFRGRAHRYDIFY